MHYYLGQMDDGRWMEVTVAEGPPGQPDEVVDAVIYDEFPSDRYKDMELIYEQKLN